MEAKSRSEEKGGGGVGEDYGYTNEKEGVDVRISSERAPTKKNGNRKHLPPRSKLLLRHARYSSLLTTVKKKRFFVRVVPGEKRELE